MKYTVNVYSLVDTCNPPTREATKEEIRFINSCKALGITQSSSSTLCYDHHSQGWLISFAREDFLNRDSYTECSDASDALKQAFKMLHSKAKDMTEQLIKYWQAQLD